MNAALAEHGHPERAEEDMLWCIGPPLKESFRRLTGEQEVDSYIHAYRSRYRTHMTTDTLAFAGIPELLAGLQAPAAVATSKPRAFAEPLLEALGLRHHFVAVEGPEFDADAEPKAVTIERAMRALPAGARAVMVGDREHDVHGAAAHGLDCIGVLWGFGTRDELLGAGAAAVAETPGELAGLLR